jgi:hypothetical protein
MQAEMERIGVFGEKESPKKAAKPPKAAPD